MSTPQHPSILCLPGLQGHFQSVSGIGWSIRELPLSDGLAADAQLLCQHYDGEDIIIGTSYGGLVAWKSLGNAQYSELKGLVLIDVLPGLNRFPVAIKAVLKACDFLPIRMQDLGYRGYRKLYSDLKPDSFEKIKIRLRSIQQSFPQCELNVPTVVLLSSQRFEEEWRSRASRSDRLLVQRKRASVVSIVDSINWILEQN